MAQRLFSDFCQDVDASLLKKGNLVLIKEHDSLEWIRVVYSVTKDASPKASGTSTTVEFKPKYTAPEFAPEGTESASFASVSNGLACNLPRFGSDSDYKFKLVPPVWKNLFFYILNQTYLNRFRC